MRESPGFGRWKAEKENPVGASSEDCNLSLHNTRAANLVVRTVTQRAEITRAQATSALAELPGWLSYIGTVTLRKFPRSLKGDHRRDGNTKRGPGRETSSILREQFSRLGNEKTQTSPTTSLVNPQSNECNETSSLDGARTARQACRAEAGGGVGGAGRTVHIHPLLGDALGARVPRDGAS